MGTQIVNNNLRKKPLVTFAVIAYNAEKFVREAVEGAFAQGYTPLEIILSDDCSADHTFALIKKMAEEYRGKNHIVLNQNEINLGIGGHVNRIMELAKGEYIIIAAGDDISVPERTERIMEVFSSCNRNIRAVFSDCIELDGYGKEQGIVSAKPPERFTELPEMCRHKFRGITGATNAWHRSVFDAFGPMGENIVFEDRVIAFRAALLGEICHIPLPLVRYRRHDTNTVGMFHSASNDAMRKVLECFQDVYLNNARDLETHAVKGDIDHRTMVRCRKIMRRELAKINGYFRFLSGRSPLIIVGLVQVLINGGNPSHAIRRRMYNSVIWKILFSNKEQSI